MSRNPFDGERRDRERRVDTRPTGSAGRIRHDERGAGLTDSINVFLARLGIAPASDHDAVVEAATTCVAATGLAATVGSLRFGRLEVVTDKQSAVLLRHHLDRVQAACEQARPGIVTDVVLKIR